MTVGGGSPYRPCCIAQLSADLLIAAPSPTCSPSSPFHQEHPIISHSSCLAVRIWADSDYVLHTDELL